MTSQTPADSFLDHVIAALISADAATLRRLEVAASTVAVPADRDRYMKKCATFAALLDASARNLRLLRRVAGNPSSSVYAARLR